MCVCLFITLSILRAKSPLSFMVGHEPHSLLEPLVGFYVWILVQDCVSDINPLVASFPVAKSLCLCLCT